MPFDFQYFSGAQYDSVVESVKRQNIWTGSVRSGKTISSIIRWLMEVKSWPVTTPFLMSGKTERTLKRNVIDPMIDMVGGGHVKLKSGIGEMELYGRLIYLAGANDERSQERIRGMTLAAAYCDEISLFPESFYTMLLSRLSVKGAKVFGTTNPDHPKHWLKKNFIDRAEELDIAVFPFSLDDNEFLVKTNPEYIAALKKEYTGIWYKRFILGEWCVADGAVYDSFDESQHVIDLGDRKFRYYIIGVDYGTTNPTSFLLIGFNEYFGPKYVVKEYYFDSGLPNNRPKTDGEYADDFIQFISGYRIGAVYIDPAAASFVAELRKRGILPRDGDNDVVSGVRYVASELNKGKLFINRLCQKTVEEFLAYVWDQDFANKHGVDRPQKENDHALDALRYAMFTHFFRGKLGIIAGLNV